MRKKVTQRLVSGVLCLAMGITLISPVTSRAAERSEPTTQATTESASTETTTEVPVTTEVQAAPSEDVLFDHFYDTGILPATLQSKDFSSCELLVAADPIIFTKNGGVMYREDIDSGEVESYLESNIGCALIDLDGESDCDLIASQYEAIKLYKNHAKGNWMPFVALMRTHHTLNDAEYSITMFPYTGNYVWECMVNKVLLLACRKTVAIDGLNPLNWEQYIDEELLMRTFSVADLYIPKSDTEESVV